MDTTVRSETTDRVLVGPRTTQHYRYTTGRSTSTGLLGLDQLMLPQKAAKLFCLLTDERENHKARKGRSFGGPKEPRRVAVTWLHWLLTSDYYRYWGTALNHFTFKSQIKTSKGS